MHKCTYTHTYIFTHTQAVKSAAVHENYIFTASADQTVRIWDLTTEKCVGVLDLHHTAAINALTVGGGHYDSMLFSCSDDGMYVYVCVYCICM